MKARIFISHADKDKVLATCFVEALKSAFSLTNSEIICTSYAQTRIPNGVAIADFLKEQFQNADFVFYLITANFIESANCMVEFAWHINKPLSDKYLFSFEGVNFQKLPTMLNGYHITPFDSCGLKEAWTKLCAKFEAKTTIEKWLKLCQNLPEENQSAITVPIAAPHPCSYGSIKRRGARRQQSKGIM